MNGFPIYLDYPVHPKPRFGWGMPAHPQLERMMEAGRPGYAALLQKFIGSREQLLRISLTAPPSAPELPCWRNGWLPGLDALTLYGMITTCRPRRYYEIGSGYSTKFARQAVRDGGLTTAILSIDPHPRAEIDALCDQVMREPLENVNLTLFDDLSDGDILFVDSTHRAFMNTDVTVIFLEILPRLAPGVRVHFHDIYLPHDYPIEWRHRYYNEQYLLAASLLAGGDRYKIEFPCFYARGDADLQSLTAPLWEQLGLHGYDRSGGSFWLKVMRTKKQ